MDPQNVIVCVIDADGRLDPESMDKVLPLFVNPDLGAVQVGVTSTAWAWAATASSSVWPH